MQKSEVLSDVKLYLFDLDGCLYYSDQPAPRAADLLQLLRNSGKRCGFVTNNSRQSAGEIAQKLSGMGIAAPADTIFTATEFVGKYVFEKYGAVTVKAAGSASLQAALQACGLHVLPLDHPDAAEVVVIGRDTEFSYAKLQLIARDADRGAVVIGANADHYHPGPESERIPETGALLAAVSAVIGRTIECIGKPEPFLFRYAMDRFEEPPSACVMVGDNLLTDITGGIRAGMRTIWIHNDVPIASKHAADRNGIVPDLIVRDIEQLYEYMID